MQTEAQDMAAFIGIAIPLSLLSNISLRRLHHGWWIACLSAAALTAVANLLHEAVLHDFAIRPSDVAFWIPAEFVFSLVMAFPFVSGISALFLLLKRRNPVTQH